MTLARKRALLINCLGESYYYRLESSTFLPITICPYRHDMAMPIGLCRMYFGYGGSNRCSGYSFFSLLLSNLLGLYDRSTNNCLALRLGSV